MNLLVIPIIFVAIFLQSLAGFGGALISMPFLILVLGPEIAVPTYALLIQTAGLIYIYKYRHDWQFPDIKILLIGMLFGIPVGTWVANSMSEEAFMVVLGIIMVGYATYALSGFYLPKMKQRWGVLFGVLAGILQSAYNVGGPPLVMYNTTQDWEAKRFKGNTQAVIFTMSIFVIFAHLSEGNITSVVLQNYLLAVPAMAGALVCGFWTEQFIEQQTFRKGVLVLLIVIGLSLIF